MLDDRPYMRSANFEGGLSATAVLMIINAAVFVLQSILSFYQRSVFTWYWEFFALNIEKLSRGYVWQLITFQFMHASTMHLLLNLLVLYLFGRVVEETLGRSRFLKFYLTAGLMGGLLQMFFAFLFPKYFGGSVVGASAGVFGLVAAFAMMFPQRQLLLFFVIPMSARTLLWIFLGMAVFGIIVPSNVADAAHLGGLLAGMAYVHWFIHGDGIPFSLPRFRFSNRGPREYVKAGSQKRGFWQRAKAAPEEDLPAGEFISREVDPILDKISAHGIQSLTERERKILEAARAKMAKR